MIVLIRSNSIISDSRICKYIDFLRERKVEYKILGWNRIHEDVFFEHTTFYQKLSGYDLGGFKAAWFRVGWMLFVIRFLCIHRNSISCVHACDLDSAFPAVLFKFLLKRDLKVLFDVFDWFSDTLFNQPYIIRLFFKLMERFSIKYSDEVIICEAERIKQIPYKLNRKELVLPNIPSFISYDFLHYEAEYQFDNSLFTFAYVGSFAKYRCLNELIQLAEDGYVNLLIAGFGAKAIVNKCTLLSENCPNLKYFGKVSYIEGLNIMYNSDVIYAMYSKENPNHIYAAPNKYYESMLLGKPIISTKGIILEKK